MSSFKNILKDEPLADAVYAVYWLTQFLREPGRNSIVPSEADLGAKQVIDRLLGSLPKETITQTQRNWQLSRSLVAALEEELAQRIRLATRTRIIDVGQLLEDLRDDRLRAT